MGTSGIDYADYAWSPWRGCSKVSDGCANCYAEQMSLAHGWTFDTVARTKTVFDAPVKRDRSGAWKWAPGSKVFVCPQGDFFHRDADGWRADAWQIMKQRPDLTFIIPTKRLRSIGGCSRIEFNLNPHVWLLASCENQAMVDERVPLLMGIPASVIGVSLAPLLGPIDLDGYLGGDWSCYVCGYAGEHGGREFCEQCGEPFPAPGPHGEMVPCAKCGGSIYMQDCPRCGRIEPFGPNTGGEGEPRTLDWVIVEGESGPRARPPHPDWVRNLRDECRQARKPFYFKQWGEWAPTGPEDGRKATVCSATGDAYEHGRGDQALDQWQGRHLRCGGEHQMMYLVGKRRAGHVLDDCVHRELPGAISVPRASGGLREE